MVADRLKESLASAVDFRIPGIDYLAEYGGTVVQQLGPNAFDFEPDDPRLPTLSGIPICLPFPGFALQLDPSQKPRARLGWDGGNPGKPEIRVWEQPGLAALVITASLNASLVAPSVNLGADPAPQPLVLGTVFTVALTTLLTALSACITAIGAGFTGGAAAWGAAAAVQPLLGGAAGIAIPVFGAAATACGTAVTAISTFLGNLSKSLSTVTRTS